MTTLAITGATGYLAARLCETLAARGDARVIGIDFMDPRRPAPRVRMAWRPGGSL